MFNVFLVFLSRNRNRNDFPNMLNRTSSQSKIQADISTDDRQAESEPDSSENERGRDGQTVTGEKQT